MSAYDEAELKAGAVQVLTLPTGTLYLYWEAHYDAFREVPRHSFTVDFVQGDEVRRKRFATLEEADQHWWEVIDAEVIDVAKRAFRLN